MDSHVVERYDETAVNCLTGSYARLAAMRGRPVAEQTVFERGDGYLFQAGLDEVGYPEYIFPVEETGALGMRRTGFAVHAEPIDFTRVGSQLAGLLERFGGVAVWVNTAHLGYADVYGQNDGYLHTVVISGIATDHGAVDVLDCLVVAVTPFACRAVLTMDDLTAAASDRIRSEAHDGMGFFYAITDERETPSRPSPAELGDALFRQAARFTAEPRFHGAIRRYQELNEQCFAGPPERLARAARRLFHHASVLYAVPSLKLMGASLRDAGASDTALALHEDALRHWQAMGVLALRYEATASSAVLTRVTDRFKLLDEVTTRLWEAVAAG